MFKLIKLILIRKILVNSVENYLLYLVIWFKVRLNICMLLVILNYDYVF